MKNIKCIYEQNILKIIRNNNSIKYNLSEENIFGNLYYSMNRNLLKGKKIEIDSAFLYKNNNLSKILIKIKPSKLIAFIRYKPYKRFVRGKRKKNKSQTLLLLYYLNYIYAKH